jgi:hypothetical protein
MKVGVMAKAGKKEPDIAARIREYLKGLTVKQRKECADRCGISLYTLNDMMRAEPRNLKRISASVAKGLHEHSRGIIDKTEIIPGLWEK